MTLEDLARDTGGLVMVLALWVSAGVERKLLHGSGNDLSIRKMAANIVRSLLLFVGLLIALSAIGIDLTALSVLGGAIGVGVGFGATGTVQLIVPVCRAWPPVLLSSE